MNIMFWVTEKCNLNCDYCYVKKQPKTMSMETAEAAFEYFKKMLSERTLQTGEIHIGFHGGEPLLNFSVIQYLTDMFKREYGGKIKYFSLTTNGTIFSEEMIHYLSQNIQLSVSIDGKRKTNDLKRHYCDGRSSYDEAIRTLEYLKKINVPCRVRMTVNQETVNSLAENYIYLDKCDYGTVVYAINRDDEWSDLKLLCYEQQLIQIMDYLINEKPEDAKYFLYNFERSTFRSRSFCDGGITNFHVSSEGGLYPCIMAVDEPEYQLGDIFTGVDEHALSNLQEINKNSVVGCDECDFKGRCSSQVCKIINKKYTGDFYTPPNIGCNERTVLNRFFGKYKYILEGFNV